jgi:hypothetical protein
MAISTGSSFGALITPPNGLVQQTVAPTEQTAALLYMRRLQEDERHRTLLNYYAFYRGTHYSYIRDVADPQMVINYSRAFIDKGASFCFANSFQFLDQEGEDRSSELDLINAMWDFNDKDKTCLKMGTIGGISGNCFLKIVYNPMTDHMVIIPLDTNCCFPVFAPYSTDEFVSFKIEFIVSTGAAGDFNDYHLYTEIYTNDTFQISWDGNLVKQEANPYGFIPIVNACNKVDPLSDYGTSDIVDQMALQRIYNEQITKFQDIVNYHSAPITVITGARLNNLVMGARKVWSGLPIGATVENLTMDSDLPALQTFIDKLKEQMHEVTSTPMNVFGQEQAISNTSNAALQTQYLPLIDKTNVKRIMYGNAIKRINNYLLRIWDIVHPGQDIDPNFQHNIRWESPLPKDEERLIGQIIVPLLQMKLIGQKQALKMLGFKDPEKILQEAREDQVAQSEVDGKVMENTTPAPPPGEDDPGDPSSAPPNEPAPSDGAAKAQQKPNPDKKPTTDSKKEKQK